MNKRKLIVAIIVIGIATSVFALAGASIAQKSADEKKATTSSPSGLKPKPEEAGPSARPAQPNQQSQTAAAQPQDQTIPQDVIYDQMFRHIKELKKNADEEDSQGKDGSHFRTLYKRMAKLEDHQAAALDQIADDVDREVEKLNKRAKKIIDDVRSSHPDGKLAPGELPPSVPAELKMLSDQRRQVILQARERLRAAFGEEAFQKFDEFVQQRIKPGIRRLNAPNGPQGQ
jgi:type IV secretory pathway VirB10-like protein